MRFIDRLLAHLLDALAAAERTERRGEAEPRRQPATFGDPDSVEAPLPSYIEARPPERRP